MKKFTAVFAAAALGISAAPMVLADDVTLFEGETVYYDESFDGMSGTLVNLDETTHENRSYEGYFFECSTRGEDTSQQSISIVADGTHGNTLQYRIAKYASSDRYLRMNLTKIKDGDNVIAEFTGDTIISFATKMTAPAAGVDAPQLIISDISGMTLSYTAKDYGVWEYVTLVVDTDNVMYTIVKDENGNVKYFEEGTSFFSTPASIEIPGTYNSTVAIDDLYIADGDYVLDEQAPIDYAKSLLSITDGNAAVTAQNDDSYNVISDFTLPTATVDASWRVEQKLKESEAWEPATYLTISSSNVIVNNTAEDVESYDYRLVATLSYGSTTDERVFNLNVLHPDTILENYAAELDLIDADTQAVLSPGENDVYAISNDLVLSSGDEFVKINWECFVGENETSNVISSTGGYYPTDYMGELTLRATLTYGDTSIPKEFKVASTVNSVTEYIDPTIASLTAVSADNSEVVYSDLKNIGTVKNDIQLPTSVKVDDGTVSVNWTVVSGADNASIDANGLLTIMTQDYNAHEVSLSAEFTYVKDSINVISKTEEGYNFTVQFTKEDAASEDSALDKYKVRFDSAYAEQFESIPTRTTTSFSLPTEGMFGSAIKWTSNAPTVISNSGSVSRPSSDRTVQLTASIMSGAASETKTYEVTVTGKGSSSGGGGGGGGSTSSTGTSSHVNGGGAVASGNTSDIYVPTTGQQVIDELIEQKEEAENAFTDLGSVSWARDAINALAEAGIINGKTETEFAPNDTVTRAEFAKMLMGVFGLNTTTYSTSSFNDVSTDAWYFQSVESAYNLGIIQGVAPGYFDPNANITRQDMAVMVVRAATLSGSPITAVNEAKVFADDASIADYAKEAVTTLQTAGIINGMTDTEFAPLSNATRAQAAQVLYSFL